MDSDGDSRSPLETGFVGVGIRKHERDRRLTVKPDVELATDPPGPLDRPASITCRVYRNTVRSRRNRFVRYSECAKTRHNQPFCGSASQRLASQSAGTTTSPSSGSQMRKPKPATTAAATPALQNVLLLLAGEARTGTELFTVHPS